MKKIRFVLCFMFLLSSHVILASSDNVLSEDQGRNLALFETKYLDTDVEFCSDRIVEIFAFTLKSCRDKFESINELEYCRENMNYLRSEHEGNRDCFAKTIYGQATIRKRFFEKIDRLLNKLSEEFEIQEEH